METTNSRMAIWISFGPLNFIFKTEICKNIRFFSIKAPTKLPNFQVHSDLVLTELENIAKWEHSKKSGASLLSFIKEATYGKATDSEIINLRATIVLSYGYVVLYCPIDMVIQRLEKTVLPFLRQYLAGFKVETSNILDESLIWCLFFQNWFFWVPWEGNRNMPIKMRSLYTRSDRLLRIQI